jgi:hypothetical protein
VSALPLPGHHSKAFLGCVVQKIRVVQRGSHPENGMIPSNNRIIILMWSVRISACESQALTMAAQSIPRVRCPKNEALWNSTPMTAVIFKSRKGDNRGAVPREPQTNPLRKRKRGKVFTAADSTPIQARIPNAMFLEIERAARHELVSIADFLRAALLEKLERERKQK